MAKFEGWSAGRGRRAIQVDMALLITVVLIVTIGIVNLYSATSVYEGSAKMGAVADIYVSQIYWIVVGVLVGILAATIDYRFFERMAYVIYGGTLVPLALVLALSADVRGSSRWIQLGGFSFQPSEFMKVSLILAVAKLIHEDSKVEPRSLPDLWKAYIVIGVPVLLVMAQPDLGTSLLLVFISISMLSLLRIHRKTLLFFAVTTGFLLWLAPTHIMHEYQVKRLTSFLNPEADITGTGWHAFQARTAIGNGGLLGRGYAQGSQNQFGFVPDQYSDFPFAVFGEDWGFIGCLVLLSLITFLCLWSVHVASQARDRFGAAVAIGAGAYMFWHSLANSGMAMGILPVVGIPLPLVSYGGSSMVSTMFALGMLMNVSMRR